MLRKAEIEASLAEENKLIQDGKLKEDNPLDVSENFGRLCEACRRGDLKVCQEMITEGASINARDRFDYTPLILVGPVWAQRRFPAKTPRQGQFMRTFRGRPITTRVRCAMRTRYIPRRKMSI